jgi:hypothetical protein
VTTEETVNSILKNNPQKGKYSIYLTGKEVGYIKVYTTNECLRKFLGIEVFEFTNLQ